MPEILEAIVARIPPPKGDPAAPLQALDLRQPLRRVQGRRRLRPARPGHAPRPRHDPPHGLDGAEAELLELGVFRPQLVPVKQLVAGEVGYVATGLKNVRDAQVGDTITSRRAARPHEPLPGYQEAKSLVFAGLYPLSRRGLPAAPRRPREAPPQRRELHLRAGELDRARLRVPLRVPRAAPHGDRPGAARARVRPRPHRLRAVGRVPGRADATAAATVAVDNPALPAGDVATSRRSSEPWVTLSVVTPTTYIGAADGALDEPPRHVPRAWSTSTRSAC